MPPPRLDGTVALITGAAGGIGAAAARRFASEGAQLLLTDARQAGLQGVASGLGADWRAHDVTSERGWQDIAAWAGERHGAVDVLPNNAGVLLAAPLADTTPADLASMHSTTR